MRFRKVFYVVIVCLLVWMCLIFGFSSQPINESSDLSMKVGERLAKVFVPGFDELSEGEQTAFAEDINYGIRKTAHFLEYMVLGVLWSLILMQTRLKMKSRIFAGIGVCALFAAGDEIHQLFVDGRTGRFMDVCIDTAGAACGILAVACVSMLIFKKVSDT